MTIIYRNEKGDTVFLDAYKMYLCGLYVRVVDSFGGEIFIHIKLEYSDRISSMLCHQLETLGVVNLTQIQKKGDDGFYLVNKSSEVIVE